MGRCTALVDQCDLCPTSTVHGTKLFAGGVWLSMVLWVHPDSINNISATLPGLSLCRSCFSQCLGEQQMMTRWAGLLQQLVWNLVVEENWGGEISGTLWDVKNADFFQELNSFLLVWLFRFWRFVGLKCHLSLMWDALYKICTPTTLPDSSATGTAEAQW